MHLKLWSVAVVAADVEPDGVKHSLPLQSATTMTDSNSQLHSNLPPRLQRKQQQAEEEKYMKYYKPMDYIRQQTNSYHKKVAANSSTQHGIDNACQNHTASVRRVSNVHSRGSVTNRTLWTDDLISVTSDQSSGIENVASDGLLHIEVKINNDASDTADTKMASSVAHEQRAPVSVLSSSSNKVVSLEAGMSLLNMQSTATSHTTPQLSVSFCLFQLMRLLLLFCT